jgi:hypothetical protein
MKVILYVENFNMDKWLKTVTLKRPRESDMTVSLVSTDCSLPLAASQWRKQFQQRLPKTINICKEV